MIVQLHCILLKTMHTSGPCEHGNTKWYMGSEVVATLYVPHGEVCLLACRNAKECMFAYFNPVVSRGSVEV